MTDILEKINTSPESIQFNEVIAYIDAHFDFTPTAFSNGNTKNEINQNNGSCKLFYFAMLNQLNEEQTLQLFGDYYRIDVLQHPSNTDHQNIRNFLKFGWQGIQYGGIALTKK